MTKWPVQKLTQGTTQKLLARNFIVDPVAFLNAFYERNRTDIDKMLLGTLEDFHQLLKTALDTVNEFLLAIREVARETHRFARENVRVFLYFIMFVLTFTFYILRNICTLLSVPFYDCFLLLFVS